MDDEDEVSNAAPVLRVPSKQIIAVEHPMIVQNLDNAIKTFGRSRPFQRIIDSRDALDVVPLYLRYNDPMCAPILSQNSPTSNVLLKITVPKRTGRKRKRGSQDPYQGDAVTVPRKEGEVIPPLIMSHSRLDNPAGLLRRLQETSGLYDVEVVGEITQSHRFRGLSDFHHSTSNTKFGPKFREIASAGDVDTLRKFKFDLSRGVKENGEFLPAPVMTSHQLPFNWGFHQNPNVFAEVDQATGQTRLVNRQGGRKVMLEYLSADTTSIPMRPHGTPPNDPDLLRLIAELQTAMNERPLWTRRALVNRIGSSKELWLFRDAIQYIGYQFRGGPFRDALIKYGVDPRSDPKYRQYQSFFFKLFEEEEKIEGMQWKDVRTNYVINKRGATKEDRESHIFDGKTVILDGKIWQACDITDPLLASIVKDAPYRDKCDNTSDGWFPEGTMAKLRAIMKTKLMAVCCKREVNDDDFEAALRIPDFIPGKKSKAIQVPVPRVALTEEEIEEMRKQGLTKAVQSSGVRKKPARQGKARTARLKKHVVKKGPEKDDNHGRTAISSKPERPILPKPPIAPATWNIPGPVIDPRLENLPPSERPLTSVENDVLEEHSRFDAQGVMDDIEDDEEGGSSGDEGTDIERDEISDGEENELDSDATDEVDYSLLYGNSTTNGQ